MKLCKRCNHEKDFSLFGKDKTKHDGVSFFCKDCTKAYLKEYRAKKAAEKCKVYKPKSPKQNPKYPKGTNRYKGYRLENPEKCKQMVSDYKKRNRHVIYALNANRRAAKLQATPSWANDFFIKEAYHIAQVRSEVTGVLHHVDHIVPLKNPLVCGLHVEHNLQVIPAVENLRKNNRFE